MSVSSVSGSTATVLEAGTKTGYDALGEADFLKMMLAQIQNQDPTDPVDQTQMLAQLAQFSSLSGITDMNDTLKSIADKLDTVIASQEAAKTVS